MLTDRSRLRGSDSVGRRVPLIVIVLMLMALVIAMSFYAPGCNDPSEVQVVDYTNVSPSTHHTWGG